MICVRGMGVCLQMKDERNDVPVPDEFKASDYHKKKLEEYQMELHALDCITEDAARAFAHAEYVNKTEAEDGYHKQKLVIKARYLSMLSKVRIWQPPTEEHEGFKKFMEEQLTGSIKFDCGDYPREQYTEQSPKDWIASRRERLLKNIEYHAKEYREELERIAERNLWLKQLRESLVEK